MSRITFRLTPAVLAPLLLAFALAAPAAMPARAAEGGTDAQQPANNVPLWPVFDYKNDPVEGRTDASVLWPLYVRQRTPGYTANQFLSCPQRYPEQYPNQSYLLWPLSGLRTGHGHDAWLFPCIWSGRDADGIDNHFALFPAFYWSRHNGDRTLNIAILQHNTWDSDSRFHALWPLFWYGSDHFSTSDSSHFGLLPLIWTSNYRHKDRDDSSKSSSGGVLLVNWWERSQSQSKSGDGTTSSNTNASDGTFPVFSRSNSASSTTSPKGNSSSNSDSRWTAPYWQSHETSHTDNPGPGGYRDTAETHHLFFPLWWDWSGRRDAAGESGRLLFPIWWSSAKTKNGEIAESAKFLVPIGAHLYKKGEYDTQNLLGPVLNRTENHKEKYVRYDAFFPIFSMTRGETRSGGRLFPLTGWGSERGKYSNLWYLFPLGWRCESQDGGAYRVDDGARFWALHETESTPFVNDGDSSSGPRRTVAFYPLGWSKRQADYQNNGFFPFWWQESWRGGKDVSTETWLPLLLGNYDTTRRDGRRTYARQDYLLSILAWGKGEDYKLRRLFPLLSYERTGGRREVWSLVPPFDYECWRDRSQPRHRKTTSLSIPFSFLPLYGYRSDKDGQDSDSGSSWFFPFYKHSEEKSPERGVERLSILWPLWNGEWEKDETRIRGIGGMTNFYEKDANGFIEQRILYRLFTRRTRSWLSEHELMPFFAQQSREGGANYWKFLGGLLGGETRTDGSTRFRFFWIPIPTGRAAAPDIADSAKRRIEHADLALNYLKHGRHDRAAVEFTLAGDARSGDRDFQLAAAEAYLAAGSEAVGEELRSSIPSSLEPLGGKGGYCDARAVHKNLRTLAIQHFQATIRLGADKPDTLRRIAKAWLDLDDNAAALASLDESDRLRPRFSTGMERITVASSRWNVNESRTAGNLRAATVLIGLQVRYPASPTILLWEAMLTDDKNAYGGMVLAPSYLSKNDAFTKQTLQRLALYERGAFLTPCREETELCGLPPSALCGHVWMATERNPVAACAIHALTILNRQVDCLLDDKKIAAAGALLPRIQKLLPAACAKCANQANRTDRSDLYSYDSAVSNAMQNLYFLHVTLKNDPYGYIAAAKDWASTLCPHQQQAVGHALAAVRLEQQYLKQWAITLLPPADAQLATRNTKPLAYSGKFFERYVNLDAILKQPGRGAVITAECIINSPDERRAMLRLGFDHALTAELNGAVVFGPKSRKIAVRDEFTVKVTLKKGENRLKLTVTDKGLNCGFFARLSDTSGNFMEELQTQTAK